MAIHVGFPRSYSGIDFDSAVWSDPTPTLAIAAAIEERAAVTAGYSIQISRWIPPEPDPSADVGIYSGTNTLRYFLRSVPSGQLAKLLKNGVMALLWNFVDMEFDYGGRDWTDFPRSLATAFLEDDHGHPMAWCPGVGDGETDDALEKWRTLIADCRWWLDRCHAVAIPVDWWKFAKRIRIGNRYSPHVKAVYYESDGSIATGFDNNGNEYEMVSEDGDTLAEQLAAIDDDVASSNGISYARRESSKSSEVEHWPNDYVSKTVENERVNFELFTNLHVQNRAPLPAIAYAVACGASGGSNPTGRLGYRLKTKGYADEWSQQMGQQLASMAGDNDVYETELIVHSERTHTHTKTDTVWTRDFSDSLVSDPEAIAAETLSQHVDKIYWNDIPYPELLGIHLGMNALGSVEAHQSLYDKLPWRGVPSLPGWCAAPNLSMHTDAPESILRNAYFMIRIVPILDYAASFHFKT